MDIGSQGMFHTIFTYFGLTNAMFKQALFLLASCVALNATAAELLLFDGHVHYSGNAWEETPPEKAIAYLKEANIARALLSSTPIEGTLKLYALDPKRFVPELRVYHKATSYETWLVERANWWRADDTMPFLENESAAFTPASANFICSAPRPRAM